MLQELITIPVGTPFARWVVVGEPELRVADKNGARRAFFPSRCICGTERFVNSQSLRHKTKAGMPRSQSCGCHRKEAAREKYLKFAALMTPPFGCIQDARGCWRKA